MSMTPKTIQIYLPGGDPRGIRVADITTLTVQVIEVPRKLLPDFIKMPQSDQEALYFLFSEVEDGTEQKKVYFGQSGDLRHRLTTGHRDRDWERVLVLVSRTNSLTRTHALFLEWHCIQASRMAGRYADENGNAGSKPHTPAPLEADCLEIFETGRSLLATLGYPIFDPVAKAVEHSKADEIFYCTGSNANGRGQYTQEGFVVLKGSIGRKENVPSIVGKATERFRVKLLESGVMREEGDTVIFEKDHLFGSPSMAAIALMGRTANGWLEWKNEDGQTLDELKRQAPIQ
jgi:hypothetical protein